MPDSTPADVPDSHGYIEVIARPWCERQEGLATTRGLLWGILFALPLWVVVGTAIIAVVRLMS